MKKEGFMSIKNDWVKKLEFDKLKLANNKIDLFWKNFKLTNKNINLFIYLQLVEQLRTFYWEDQLNKELNLDDSYKQIIFYKANDKTLKDLLFNIIKDWKKDIIEDYKFKNKNLYINWEKFKLKNSEAASCFLELISLYFSENSTKEVTVQKLDEYYVQNPQYFKCIKYNLNNIKWNYLKTIRNQLWKIYINNELLYIKWNTIHLMYT